MLLESRYRSTSSVRRLQNVGGDLRVIARCGFDNLNRRHHIYRRRAVQNDTRREQLGQDNTNAPLSVTGTHDLRVVRHHAGDGTAALRHHFRHHMQKARRLRTGPDLQLQLVAGAGFEPATFGL
jgi:hypothetical protein